MKMECTQRLECTQELNDTRSEKIHPEQIGFLGICGVKHPVKRGPNKIGRDPQTCSIVLNLNSISRQHAVINVLNQREFMLMDLDSANKTKLMDKTLSAYIPHPLHDGDMVQFGDIFGVFRLLEEDNELPMTQAIDLPETPIAPKHISKFNKGPTTTIPESPDVSDREESFIAPSQPKGQKCFMNSNNNHFIKPSEKVISIQPVGSNKIDNVFWNSSKKSVSLDSQFNDSSLNSSTMSDKICSRESNNASIFEMETQPPPMDVNDSIYSANTQLPNDPATIHTDNTQMPIASPSIYDANTQIPSASPSIHTDDTQNPNTSSTIHTADTQIPNTSPIHSADTQKVNTSSIHSLNTQIPITCLPQVCKIDDQEEMQFDLFTSNKQNNIFEANTQLLTAEKDKIDVTETTSEKTPEKNNIAAQITKKLNISDEIILFDEVDGDQFEEDFDSQPLLPPEPMINDKENDDININNMNESNSEKKCVKKDVIIHSDSSTDCEDITILPTQKIPIVNVNDDEDLTDCEDLFSDVPDKKDNTTKLKSKNVSFEDMLTQVIDDNVIQNNNINKSVCDDNIADMLTQVIVPENRANTDLEDMPTQIIVAGDDIIIAENPILSKDTPFEDMATQVITGTTENTSSINNKVIEKGVNQDFVSPFKIPLMSPIKLKRKDTKNTTPKSKPVSNNLPPISIPVEDDDNYYAATQDILDDLCTQTSSADQSIDSNIQHKECEIDDDLVVGKKVTPMKKQHSDKSFESSDGEEKVNNFVSNLSSQQIRDMVGVESNVATLQKAPSDASDLELTPKKVRPMFMDIDLPSSQEIKSSVSSVYNKSAVTESSSESEEDNDSQECTPILFRKKKKPKVGKIVFEAETLPTRVITRVRKPTSKLQGSEDTKLSSNILKPNYLTEQEDDIDKEIITENITRLKNKSEKSKNKETKKVDKKSENSKCEKENATTSSSTTKGDDKNRSKSSKQTKPESAKSKAKDQDVERDVNKMNKANEKTINTVQTHTEHISDQVVSKTKKKQIASKSISTKHDNEENEKSNITVDTTLKNVRSTRKRKAATVNDVSPISVIENDNSHKEAQGRSSRRQNNKKTIEIDLTEVVEVRRSGRQRTSRDKKEKIDEKPKKSSDKTEKPSESIVKYLEQTAKTSEKIEKAIDKTKKVAPRRGRPPKHEQSTVYSLSSDSGTDSPRNAKRSAPSDLGPPSSKRTRSVVNTSTVTSLRATPARVNKTHHVLFTAFSNEEVQAKLEKLGAVLVPDVPSCSVVLTVSVKRTFKLLCAVGRGRPVVGPDWVQACVDANMIVDPWLYILKDDAAEKRFQFNLQRTLTGKRNFLKGYNVSATPGVMPSPPEMKQIVESSGGTWAEGGASWVCVSCSSDRAQWAALRARGARLVSTEFILGGVLRQTADVDACKLPK